MSRTESKLDFNGRVAIITGAARGLGREYALLLASRGCSVVVNDLGGSRDGTGTSPAADATVEEIRRLGGTAVADYNSVENGDRLVKTAIDNFGRVDIIINNAGILRDKSMVKITDDDWDLVQRVHLRGAFMVCKAAWPYMRAQSYGRIVMTSSPSGVYGNFGQANYSSAKLGLVSLAKTLSVEGSKYDIKCNSILPVAASRLTEDLMPEDVLELFQPQYVAPIVAYLCHQDCPVSGEIFEAAGGYYGRYQIQRSQGKVFRDPVRVQPEDIQSSWDDIMDMSNPSCPRTMEEHTFKLIGQLQGIPSSPEGEPTTSLKSNFPIEERGVFRYSAQDAILYALSIGTSVHEDGHLNYLYEANDPFKVFPTIGTSISLNAIYDHETFAQAIVEYNLEDNIIRALHGEQYLRVCGRIPESGTLISKPRILDVLDKGSGALMIIEVNTYDEEDNLIFYNQMACLMLGSGNFGGARTSNKPGVIEAVPCPNRTPDAVVVQKTTAEQAALFRLCGDRNPLHIDPNFSIIGGFEQPILHGLCMLGFGVRHALREFANYDSDVFVSTKARFVGTIIPGQTLETRLWRSSQPVRDPTTGESLTRIHFECVCKETSNKVVSASYVDLKLPSTPPPPPSQAVFTSSQAVAAPLASSRPVLTHSQSDSHQTLSHHLRTSSQPSDAATDTGSVSSHSSHTVTPQTTSTKATSTVDSKLYKTNPELKTVTELKSNSSLKMNDKSLSLLNSIPTSGVKSDLVFTLLGNRMHEEPEFVRKIRASYQFNITQNGQPKTIWTAENKSDTAGAVYQGLIREGKPDCIATVEDEDFIKLMFGKLNPQRAFMLGKLKVKGNIMLLQKLNSLWLELVKSGKTPEFPYIIDLMSKTDIIAGLRSEVMIIELIQRLIRLPYLCNEINKVGIEIFKNDQVATQYTIDFTQNKQTGVFERGLPKDPCYCVISMTDETFTLLTYHQFTLEDGISSGQIKVRGDTSVVPKLSILFKTPTSRVKL